MSDDDKMKQIVELKQIVSGIRLFNRDSHKGGEGIDDSKSLVLIHFNFSFSLILAQIDF